MNRIMCFFIVSFYLLITSGNLYSFNQSKEFLICQQTSSINRIELNSTVNQYVLNQVGEIIVPPLEVGNYKGLWSSIATNGSVFKDLKITARITKVSDTEYRGILYISKNFKSCCRTPGSNGDGVITIKIINGNIIFKWLDEIPKCPGVFYGNGVYKKSNRIELNLTGKDCDGDHKGSLLLFK